LTTRSTPPLIGALMRRPVMAVRQQIHADLVAQGFEDLHPAHLSVFQFPGPDGRRPIELAESAQMTKQAMNHLLGQLSDLGFLARASAGRGRGTLVRLTPKGRAALRAIRESVARVEQRWRTALGAGPYRRLHELLVELNAHLDADSTGPREPSPQANRRSSTAAI
jgi:DNA-binding MarR family transcriptional regulator